MFTLSAYTDRDNLGAVSLYTYQSSNIYGKNTNYLSYTYNYFLVKLNKS